MFINKSLYSRTLTISSEESLSQIPNEKHQSYKELFFFAETLDSHTSSMRCGQVMHFTTPLDELKTVAR